MTTSEQLEDHFDAVDESKMQPGGEFFFTQQEVKDSPGTVIPKICGIYQTIRPFLDWASRFFLIPKKVKTVIKGFMALNDTLCPAA